MERLRRLPSAGRAAKLILLAWFGGACSEASHEQISRNTSGLFNGTTITSSDPQYSNVVNLNDALSCSATLISPRWALTARHCLTANGSTVSVNRRGEIRSGFAFMHPTMDSGLARLTSDYGSVTPGRFYAGTIESLYGKSIDIYGLQGSGLGGIPNKGTGFVIKNQAQPNGYVYGLSPSGQMTCQGDSGGPGFFLSSLYPAGLITGVQSAYVIEPPGGNCPPLANTTASQVSMPHARQWIDQTLFSADFDVGGSFVGSPAAAEVSAGNLNVYGVGQNGAFWYNNKNLASGTWFGWAQFLDAPTGGATSDPAAVQSPNGKTYLFVRGSDNAMRVSIRSAGGSWSPWSSLGGSCTSGPGAATDGGSGVRVYCRGQDGNIYEQSGEPWTGWNVVLAAPPVGISTSPPAAAPQYVFVRGANNHILYSRRVSGTWQPWVDIGGQTTFGPAVASSMDGRLDVFAVGTNNRLWHKVYDHGWFEQSSDDSWISIPTNAANVSGRPVAYAPGGRAPQVEVIYRSSSQSFSNLLYAY